MSQRESMTKGSWFFRWVRMAFLSKVSGIVRQSLCRNALPAQHVRHMSSSKLFVGGSGVVPVRLMSTLTPFYPVLTYAFSQFTVRSFLWHWRPHTEGSVYQLRWCHWRWAVNRHFFYNSCSTLFFLLVWNANRPGRAEGWWLCIHLEVVCFSKSFSPLMRSCHQWRWMGLVLSQGWSIFSYMSCEHHFFMFSPIQKKKLFVE